MLTAWQQTWQDGDKLSDYKTAAWYNGKASDLISVSRNSPQVSFLGPDLFMLHINDKKNIYIIDEVISNTL